MKLYHYTDSHGIKGILKEGFRCSKYSNDGIVFHQSRFTDKAICVAFFLDSVGAKIRLKDFIDYKKLKMSKALGTKGNIEYMVVIDIPKNRILIKERSYYFTPVWYYLLQGKVSKKYIVDIIKL